MEWRQRKESAPGAIQNVWCIYQMAKKTENNMYTFSLFLFHNDSTKYACCIVWILRTRHIVMFVAFAPLVAFEIAIVGT